MAELARSLNVPERYNCHLFDSRKDGVEKLVDHLHTALAGIEPINVPGLSIFVAPTDSIKEKSFAFFHKIGIQAKTAEIGYGEWVERHSFLAASINASVPSDGRHLIGITSCRP